MDPITLIVTAIAAGAANGLKPAAEKAISDAYEGLKGLISRKYGQKPELVDAIEKIEQRPDSSARLELLREEVEMVGIAEDEEVVQAAGAVVEKAKDTPEGKTIIQQTVSGNQNVFSGTGNVKANFGKG